MQMPKLFLGPMSKNIVDNILKLNYQGLNIGIIPSRRQIECDGGYVNNWTTEEFAHYVGNSAIICRDHGGPGQGQVDDDGIQSLVNDCQYMNVIHIDPWKTKLNFKECLEETVRLMKMCYKQNRNILFEIGTEEGIRKLSIDQIYDLINYIKKKISFFNNLRFVVIQSGTNLKLDMNIGSYEESKLIEMVHVAKEFGIMTKEHNGDYIASDTIRSKFKSGLDAINIAPEFGRMETDCYLDKFNDNDFEIVFQICYESKTWVKWLKGDNSFDPFKNKERLIKTCGHYIFSNEVFMDLIKDIDIKETLFNKMRNRVYEILNVCE